MIARILSLYFIVSLCLSKEIFIHNYTNIIHGESDVYDALYNGEAVYQAIQDANENDMIILEKNENIYYIPYNLWDKKNNITLKIDGKVILHDNYSAWPMISESEYYSAFHFTNSKNIIITGNGKIDGQGFNWWSAFQKKKIVRKRPTILLIEDSSNVNINKLKLWNSPRFNIYGYNITNITVNDIEIYVKWDITKTFPYNTDGIDVSGSNIHIFNNKITNFDDAIAIKPLKNTCTENVLVENNKIVYGVGISIGSVPSSYHHCVKNVLFRNIHANKPYKLIYIKTESSDKYNEPVSMISNITYDNISAEYPKFWPIYIGPQQQKEPDGTGAGFWPNTNPNVNIRNITMKNIKIHGINPSKHVGVLRCNKTNPCMNIIMNNIQIKGSNLRYICDNNQSIYGKYSNINPTPKHCINENY